MCGKMRKKTEAVSAVVWDTGPKGSILMEYEHEPVGNRVQVPHSVVAGLEIARR